MLRPPDAATGLLAIALVIVPAATSRAEDLLSANGTPWWRELAHCAGLTLAVRDLSVERHDPAERIAGLTRDMNAYLDAAAGQLRKDRRIEPSPARRSVHQEAAKTWESYKKSGEVLDRLEVQLPVCKASLATHRALP